MSDGMPTGDVREPGTLCLRSRPWALALALGLLWLLLVPAPEFFRESLWEALGNAVHVPLMAAFSLLLWLRWGSAPRSYGWIALAGAVTAAAMELLQPWFGRTASVVDFFFGLLGVSAALCGIWAWREGGRRARVLHAAFTLLLLYPMGRPVWLETRAALWRRNHFPVLGEFESAIEMRLWRDRSPGRKWPTTLSLSGEHVSGGRRSLAVHAGGGAWPGVIYLAGGTDWSAYHELKWDMYNPGEPFRFTVRVDDEIDPRFASSFHRSFTADTGWNHFSLPLLTVRRGPRSRELDLTRVRHLYVYADGERSRLFFLDDVRLVGGQ